MKYLVLAALASVLAAAPAYADGGASLSYLTVDGCVCSYGSFSPSATKFTVDPSGPQATAGTSRSPVTISVGNQTQPIQAAFSLNGATVGATSTPSQPGASFTSAPITLTPGSNVVTVTVSGPFQSPTVLTVTIPYQPVVLANVDAPVASTSPNVCAQGTWQSAPAASFSVAWEGSADGQSWATGLSTGSRFARCRVTASNGYSTVTAYSAPVPFAALTAAAAATSSTPAKVTTSSSSSTPTPDTAPALAASSSTSSPLSALKPTPKIVAASPALPPYLKVEKPIAPIRVHRFYAATLARLLAAG